MYNLRNLYFKSAAALTVFALSTVDAEATGLEGLTTTVEGQLNALPGLIRALCYIGGLGFGIAGVLKLKEYMDKPGQVNLKDPLGRLLVGALLIAIPAVLAIVVESTTSGSTQTLKPGSFELT
jgi:hypothetical protein